eukprot:CAMPEP_0176191374 /NCGR_PEP_ID=MMETSP0121_2-20121125/4428_1 /TAXON_ID=160619 /ORGANISM="Kryptoperidinium foliaceum, Strain CCMP 1326" /LENGTH=806 /DNA_ID=CAMNT_0017530039 /DNA_START=1 /DNA_END=2421 /DNA_ORIENTATION=-
MALQESGKCTCGNTFAGSGAQQVPDSACGNVCPGEKALSPTRYCGTGTNYALYRIIDYSSGNDAPATTPRPELPPPPSAAGAKQELLGAWLFGRVKSRCFVSEDKATGKLSFSVPLPQGQVAAGPLRATVGDWYEAKLQANDGEDVGTIRLRLAQPSGTLVSNFKYPGDTVWGKNTVAHKDSTSAAAATTAAPMATTAAPSPAKAPEDGSPGAVKSYLVVNAQGLYVRQFPDVAASVVDTKWAGMVVQGQRQGDWLKLHGETGYMLMRQHGKELLDEVSGNGEDMTTLATTAPPVVTTTVTTTTLPPTTTSTTTIDEHQLLEWRVVTPHGLYVRADPNPSSLVLASKVPGARVRGRRVGDWLQLEDQRGFMKVRNGPRTFMKVDESQFLLPFAIDDGEEGSTECLKPYEKGCPSIFEKDSCLRSADGRGVESLAGKKVHGQPCVWCSGQRCTSSGNLCDTKDAVRDDPRWRTAGFEAASCKSTGASHDVKAFLGNAPSLFCFSLIMPVGYEVSLMQAQAAKAVGIFDCDDYLVLSNVSVSLGKWNSTGPEILTATFPGTLVVPFGGKWHTALNTDVFLRVWRALYKHGGFAHYDWTVKVDADAVFFPGRLQDVLSLAPMASVPVLQQDSGSTCGQCKMPGHTDETCTDRVRSMERRGLSCEEALGMAARDSPKDCGCTCGAETCFAGQKLGAMFLVNCRFGLHGPIEVLSREAVEVFINNIPECDVLKANPWGEDKYLDHCLQLLGVRRVLEFELLNEIACGQSSVQCTASNVAFHPFKGIGEYFQCFGTAKSNGQWPGNALRRGS